MLVAFLEVFLSYDRKAFSGRVLVFHQLDGDRVLSMILCCCYVTRLLSMIQRDQLLLLCLEFEIILFLILVIFIT